MAMMNQISSFFSNVLPMLEAVPRLEQAHARDHRTVLSQIGQVRGRVDHAVATLETLQASFDQLSQNVTESLAALDARLETMEVGISSLLDAAEAFEEEEGQGAETAGSSGAGDTTS